jgi:RNA polymerase sigma-70 factor (ECF subfamily)
LHELALGRRELDLAADFTEARTADLVRRARGGDKEAFGALVSAYEQMVLRTALRLLGQPEAAQDAAQETFLRLFRYLHRFDERRPLGPWLYRVVVNACHDLGRKARGPRLVSLDEAPERVATSGGPGEIEAAIERRDQRRLVEEALMTLPEKERAALVLRDLEGLSTAEVAHILQSSEGTIRSQISTARVKIKRLILKDQGAPK